MKGIQIEQGVERRLGEKPRASHISPKNLDVSDSNQSDLKLDSDAITTKPTISDSTRKLIPIYSQNIIQNLMLFPNIKRSTMTYYLAIFGLKFHLSVKYPCNIRFCCAIILTEQIININQILMLFLNIRKTRCHFGPRLLYSGYSLYLLALDLSLAIQFQKYKYETSPTNIDRYYTSSPASAYA